MNISFKTVVNDWNDLPSCQIGFSGEKGASGEYRFDGYTVRQNT